MPRKPMINTMQREKFTNLLTPEFVVKPLMKYIPYGVKIIWECASRGKSNIAKIFRENKFEVIETDVETGFDFLIDKPDFEFDMIVTNPPYYDEKTKFLRRCYEYNKPFALLLPLTTQEGVERGELFQKYGISVIVFDRRIDFTGKGACWFNASWFIWNPLFRQPDKDSWGDPLCTVKNNRLHFERLKK
jgi:hypothetical protein